MALTETQIKILEGIQANLRKGDVKEITQKTGLSREYVSRVLNLSNDFFNEDVVNEAVKIISAREQFNKKLLNKLSEIIQPEDNSNIKVPHLQTITQ